MYENQITNPVELENLFATARATSGAKFRIHFDEKFVGLRGLRGRHEIELRTSYDDLFRNGPTGRRQASVAFWYQHLLPGAATWTSATIHLYANDTNLTDIGWPMYLMTFTTRPFGRGMAVTVLYVNDYPEYAEFTDDLTQQPELVRFGQL